MNRGIWWALGAALALPSCTSSVAPLDSRQLSITGGEAEAGYPSVFSLAFDGTGSCTGTCVTPHIGVTAKHCLWGGAVEDFSALFGATEADPDVVIDVTALAMAEGEDDIAAIAFTDECPATTPLNRADLAPFLDDEVVMVGYGVTSEYGEDFGRKRSGEATLYSVDPDDVNGLSEGELATSNDPAGTCYGDSGGPTFMVLDDAEVLVGVTSRGSLDAFGNEEPCGSGVSIAVRTDSHAAFLDDFIAAHETDAPGDEDPEPGEDPGGDDDDEPGDEDPDHGPGEGDNLDHDDGDVPDVYEPLGTTDSGGAMAGGGCAIAAGPGTTSTSLLGLLVGAALFAAARRRSRR